MNRYRELPRLLGGLLALLLVGGCDKQQASDETPARATESPQPAYVVLDESLGPLIERFNAAAGKVRQVFLVGPTCGICLRGMADLNDEYIAELQRDDRLQTYVVHLPTLGAREEHVAPAIPLLNGPNVHHFWDSSGILGQHYQALLNVRMYVWDIWFIYGPDARWSERLPPEPDFFQHQLAGFPLGERLDKKEFAVAARAALAQLPEQPSVVPDMSETERLADGAVIPVVAQPRGVAVQQHIMGRGGYRLLKTVQSITAEGTIEFGGRRLPLSVWTDRSEGMQRQVGTASDGSTAIFGDGEPRLVGSGGRGLAWNDEVPLFEPFDFDGPLVDWPDKGHELTMNGMRKVGAVLAWDLGVLDSGGRRWQFFVDSHSGDVVRATLLNSAGEPRLQVDSGDFRDVDGVRLPFLRTYRAADGSVLATEQFESIQLAFQEA